MNDMLEQLPALPPLHFFDLNLSVPRKKEFRLLNTSELLGEEHFADVSISWNEEGVSIEAKVDKPFEESVYPDFREGDSFEIFLDTRDLKSAGFATRFCHHFLILPQETQGIRAQEITRFRTEDTHPLADPEEIFCETKFSSRDFSLRITLPAHILHGYAPSSFDRLGFTYRINRPSGAPQHFSVSSKFYSIEQHPSLWASLKLC